MYPNPYPSYTLLVAPPGTYAASPTPSTPPPLAYYGPSYVYSPVSVPSPLSSQVVAADIQRSEHEANLLGVSILRARRQSTSSQKAAGPQFSARELEPCGRTRRWWSGTLVSSSLCPSDRRGALLIDDSRCLSAAHFRLFVGNLDPALPDKDFEEAFSKPFPSFVKARIVRDKMTHKAKYGFVSFEDPEEMLKACKKLDGESGRPPQPKKSS